MNKPLMDMTSVIGAGLELLVPIVFVIAFVIWWRRVRHWSFGVLSLALVLYLSLQVFTYLDAYAHLGQVFTPERNSLYVVLAFVENCIVGTLILVGGWGLIVAGRKQEAGKG